MTNDAIEGEGLGLTPREIQVVTLVGRDRKYKEIAELPWLYGLKRRD
jgi:hypothetical protein